MSWDLGARLLLHKLLGGFRWPPMMIFSIFYDTHVVFGEYRDTIVVAQLSNGN